MITVEKLEKGTYFDDAFKISFRYDPTTVAKVKELAERRYLPEDRAWEIPAHELPALIEKVGLSNIKSEEAVVQALNTKEIEDKREATQERLKGIKPVRDFDFKTAPLPHQIEAFNYGMEKNSLLIGDEQGLGKTKESIDICVARKKELIKTLIRALNTELADLYMVSIPVITCWVRDDNYVSATGEIYLTEPELEPFLHQFRHHLQNVERKYDRRGLTAEGLNGLYYKVPYTKCVYKLYGEDDARAWARMVIELAS